MPPATKNAFAALGDSESEEEQEQEEEVEEEEVEEEPQPQQHVEEVHEPPAAAKKGKAAPKPVVQAKTESPVNTAAVAKAGRKNWADDSDSEQSPSKAGASPPKEKKDKAKKPVAMGKNKFAMLLGDESEEAIEVGAALGGDRGKSFAARRDDGKTCARQVWGKRTKRGAWPLVGVRLALSSPRSGSGGGETDGPSAT
eukprot:CAMPEP_0176153188 /NCGR_PEP_ID=MMETSP0120_2-20121206/78244_1 /TAXON_ID=160619 /ORGANISM="Kryptoperidinium foliaceum, Strain CCMP 1326" /LENGTH=197 /DNA_ID=CAMNT_0017490221 /DNA_START=64 /DNA_END=655 /DNA_ORIENTATION=+